jgi:hypothetical protein
MQRSKRSVPTILGRGLMVMSILAGIGAVSGGCLTRKVVASQPSTKLNYTAVVRQSAIDKIDLLFAIDNSASMGDKQAIFGDAVPDLIGRLLSPLCVDDEGKTNGQTSKIADADGPTYKKGESYCDQGKPEFQAVHDMHIGIVSSSLGAKGSDQCLDANDDDQGHLVNRTKIAGKAEDYGDPVADAEPGKFLAWLPPVEKNIGKPDPVVPKITEITALQKDFADMVVGTKERGCGYEAQLESAYRFLVQPDPYEKVVVEGDAARLSGYDDLILKQRKDFLRPDSLVAVIMLTDENESTVDPLAFGGRSYRFASQGRVPPGTSTCATDPMASGGADGKGPKCISCQLKDANGDPGCAKPLTDDEDQLNVRFFHMKQRFGVDPRFPVERYIQGFSADHVPNREGEHPNNSFNYQGNANCINPLFATDLPTSSAGGPDSLCNLKIGPRSPDLIFFAIIGGVPWQMLTEDPTNFSQGNSAPFKTLLTADDWQSILGSDPLAYDFTGQDKHMQESIAKRDLGADDAHSREWDTKFKDLQFACTFELPTAKDCTQEEFKGACDCEEATDAPLCDNSTKTLQTRGKAYPTISQLQVARMLGEQAIVASLCPREPKNKDSADYGYRPAVKAIVDRLRNALAEQCLPQPLAADKETGKVPCLILQSFQEGDQATACDPAKGLKQPEKAVLDRFRAEQGDAGKTQPVCEVQQLTGNKLVSGSCEDSGDAGWCYITAGTSKTKCAQAIKFSKAFDQKVGSRVSLQCIKELGGDTTGGASTGDGG